MRTKILAVTGGIGSGKSLVCSYLAALGVPVYDSDSRTKALYDENPEIVDEIEKVLGISLRTRQGHFDRALLAREIFSDPEKLAAVEAIVHPALIADFRKWETERQAPLVAFESAIILEKPLFNGFADMVLLVDAPEETRIDRAVRRDGKTREEVAARMANQSGAFRKCRGIDFILPNDGDEESLHVRVNELYNKIKNDMNYDFDEVVPRRGTNSVKWDTARDGVIPMWVADMDFRIAPCIADAIGKRVAHGIFGYTHVPEEYYDAVIRWNRERHGFVIEKDWITYLPGVVPALSAIIKAMTVPGDNVLIMTPVYNCFFSSIRNNGCNVLESPLVYADGHYSIDFADLAAKAALPETKVMILCNPHNPGGRVWTKEELKKIGEICIENGVFVIADEIHCELVFPEYDYTPFASVSEDFLRNSATCVSPGKAFNIAGLQIANIVCADSAIHSKIERAINVNEVCDVNPLGVSALIAAYGGGAEWLDSLKEYLRSNYRYLVSVFERELPDFPLMKLEGTYLAWVDCSVLKMKSKEIEVRLIRDSKVWINAGTLYGEAGEGFIRINFACPRATLEQGLERIVSGLKSLRK